MFSTIINNSPARVITEQILTAVTCNLPNVNNLSSLTLGIIKTLMLATLLCQIKLNAPGHRYDYRKYDYKLGPQMIRVLQWFESSPLSCTTITLIISKSSV